MRRDTLETRNKLIKAAENLFASRGIDAVSLSDINREAEQKNRNAVLYHFGDKASLINAVLDKHTAGIEIRRQQLLDEAGKIPSLRQVVEALVLPVADKLEDPDGGPDFLRINGQLISNSAWSELRLERAETLPQARRLRKAWTGLLPDISSTESAARMLLVDCMLFQGLAAYAGGSGRIKRSAFLQTLIASLEVVLSRPM
jgi:AcrR family transcriptional regulator